MLKDYFLNQTALAERPEECRVLYQLVHPDDNIGLDISGVGLMIKEDFGEALLPWLLFLLVHMDKHEMALDYLEENIKKRTVQIVNYMNIPILQPLRQ